MIKKRKSLFLKLAPVVLVFLLFNITLYSFQHRNTGWGLTGFSIKSNVIEVYSSMSIYFKILFIGQWIVLIFILLAMVIKHKKVNYKGAESIDIQIKKSSDKKKTDLDSLYDILKIQKELKIPMISKYFNVEKNVANKWCEILESADLATIEYPGFGEPIVRIIDKNTILHPETEMKSEVKNEISPKKEEKKVKPLGITSSSFSLKNKLKDKGAKTRIKEPSKVSNKKVIAKNRKYKK